ncbi:MAG: hypothetical protein ACRCZ2_10655 [Fusobacteriaceae bacterium]
MNMESNLKPVNSIKLRYTIDPKWVNELYPTNVYNNCNLSKLELTIPNFRKYNTRAKYEEVCNTDVFFQIILNRLEFYKPELREAIVVDTDIEKYKFLIGNKIFLKNKNVGMNRHNFIPEDGTFDVFISDINNVFGYIDKEDNSIKGLNNSVVCSLPLGEPFESIKIDGMKSLSDNDFYYRVVNYESPQYGATLDLFNKQLKIQDISRDIKSDKVKIGDMVVHTTDFIYRSNICSVNRESDEIKLFVLYESIVAKKE